MLAWYGKSPELITRGFFIGSTQPTGVHMKSCNATQGFDNPTKFREEWDRQTKEA